jgi:hypothetical protein
MSWGAGFLLTLAVELPVYGLGLRARLGALGALGFAVAVNALTHPLAWHLTAGGSWGRFIAVELGVWAAEAALAWLVCLHRARPLAAGEAIVLALSANALSAGAGLLLG